MIGNLESMRLPRRRADLQPKFRDSLRQRGQLCRRFGIAAVAAQHEAWVLDRRTAARGGDEHRVQAAFPD